MSFQFPEKRKMHVVRIFGTNRNEEILPEIWLDVLRIDKMSIKTQEAINVFKFTNRYQEVSITLKWNDKDGEQGEFESRKTETVKICSPDEEDPEDPEEWIPVEVIKKVRLAEGNVTTNRNFLKSVLRDANRKEVKFRRFHHYDTNIDEMAEAAANEGAKLYHVLTDNYNQYDDTKDEDQYIEHEVVKKSNIKATPHWAESPAGNDLKTTFTFKNDFLFDGSGEAEDYGGGDINPPWRLDPFQNIINCNFGESPKQWLAGTSEKVETGGESSPGDRPWNGYDSKGQSYGDILQGASGSGFTVLCHGGVAYGKLTMPDEKKRGVFLAVDLSFGFPVSGAVRLGVVTKGKISWSTVFSVPPYSSSYGPYVTAVSYADEKFFITYNQENDQTFVAVTTDGESFISVPTVFNGRNVAYLEDVGFAMTGFMNVHSGGTPGDDSYISSTSLAWATSRDGYIWTVGHNESATGGPASFSTFATNIAAGNGIFVAASASKHSFTRYTGIEPTGQYILTKSAVAVSRNGTSWNLVPLPHGVVASVPGQYDQASYGVCVAFIKDKSLGSAEPVTDSGVDAGNDKPNGFFVCTDYSYANTPGPGTTSNLYTSVDGGSWGTLESDGGGINNYDCATAYSSVTAIAKNVNRTTIVRV